MASLDAASFAALVDHTLLKPEATEAQVVALCAEAAEFDTASVCVNGLWVDVVARELAGTGVDTCSVVGFPLGATTASAVAAEAAEACERGAVEIDMVIPVGPLQSGDDERVGDHVREVRRACDGAVLKVIFETALLTDDEIDRACRISVDAGADFVKTSTGFNPAGGATVEAVRRMRAAVGPDIGVKASGGIRTLSDVEAMIAAGASRLGMSATASVVDEIRNRSR